jgi:exoribonuclease-2
VDLAEDGVTIVDERSCIERIRVADNLRHDRLDAVVTEAALDGASDAAAMPHGDALRALWRLTHALAAAREQVRGRPEPRGRADYTFYVDGEQVRIVERRRDAPLDRIVAELMILANSRWGKLLADHGVPGVYRSQAPAGRVRMGTHPLPHQQLGVRQYAWCTSPLRRYVDLVNQRQILAVLSGKPPPHPPQDADLFSVISGFDAKYAAYAEFQQRMERYWCLRWLAQQRTQGAQRTEAVVVRDDLVRLAHAPYYFRLADLPALAPGRRIVIDVLDIDEIELALQARFVQVDDGAPVADAVEPFEDEVFAAAVDSGEPTDAVTAVDEASRDTPVPTPTHALDSPVAS